MKNKLAAMALMTAVSVFAIGCTNGIPVFSLPELTFEQVQPVSLNVAKIEIFDDYKSPMAAPNIEYTFKTPPARATRLLVERQLKADGVEKILRVFITDASVVEENLPVTTGFKGMMLQEPSQRYNARVALRFELVDEQAPDIAIGHAQVTATRTKTVMENISLASRDRAHFELTEELMKDVSNGLETIVRDTFGRQ